MKALDLSCHRLWKLDRKGFRRLRNESVLDVSVCDPDYLSLVVVETRDDVGDINRLPTLVQLFSAQHRVTLRIFVEFLIHHSDDGVR